MARTKKADAEQKEKTVPVSFRVSESVRAALDEKCARAGYTKSEWMREAVMENRTEIIERSTMTVDAREVLRIFRNQANNLNQIAHRVNADALAGLVGELTYRLILEELREQTRVLKSALKGVVDGRD